MGVCKILFSYLMFDFEVDAICVLILSSLCFVKSAIVGESANTIIIYLWQTKNSNS